MSLDVIVNLLVSAVKKEFGVVPHDPREGTNIGLDNVDRMPPTY